MKDLVKILNLDDIKKNMYRYSTHKEQLDILFESITEFLINLDNKTTNGALFPISSEERIKLSEAQICNLSQPFIQVAIKRGEIAFSDILLIGDIFCTEKDFLGYITPRAALARPVKISILNEKSIYPISSVIYS